MKPEDRSKDLKFARWIVANVTKNCHPDNYLPEKTAKHYRMSAVCGLIN